MNIQSNFEYQNDFWNIQSHGIILCTKINITILHQPHHLAKDIVSQMPLTTHSSAITQLQSEDNNRTMCCLSLGLSVINSCIFFRYCIFLAGSARLPMKRKLRINELNNYRKIKVTDCKQNTKNWSRKSAIILNNWQILLTGYKPQFI